MCSGHTMITARLVVVLPRVHRIAYSTIWTPSFCQSVHKPLLPAALVHRDHWILRLPCDYHMGVYMYNMRINMCMRVRRLHCCYYMLHGCGEKRSGYNSNARACKLEVLERQADCMFACEVGFELRLVAQGTLHGEVANAVTQLGVCGDSLPCSFAFPARHCRGRRLTSYCRSSVTAWLFHCTLCS